MLYVKKGVLRNFTKFTGKQLYIKLSEDTLNVLCAFSLRHVTWGYEVKARTDRDKNKGDFIEYVKRAVICHKVFQIGSSKICGRQPLKSLK